MPKVILTQDSAYRGGRKIALKDTVDEACTERVETVLVYHHTVMRLLGSKVVIKTGMRLWSLHRVIVSQ